MTGDLTHVDGRGRVRMVDVTQKALTHRQAVAACTVTSPAGAIGALDPAQRAEVLATARVIGIQAAKRTAELIPLCHPLLIGDVSVDLQLRGHAVGVTARVECTGQTGVEMEALTACAAAALAIVERCQQTDPQATVAGLRVLEKRGGRSGTWRAADAGPRGAR